ncbi:hypothetical protein GQ55_6G031700 [Panicum hallii var. hallii]|uniref:DUF4220 domain-containing protein n=1 Tax=Panicum hallii var. hallii TaxID=1504633 RepID=A0A2T7D3E9_9POAL|nr:hypothetical protein GQ55_6G031700 [Panicum hallii var. hallii]
MGFSSVVQLWEEWQLRILVLGSLAIQCFLAVFAGARKSPVRPLYRFLIWLSYLGSDALAIYALATLFNRQSKVQQSSKYPSRDLEVLWTPILLMHLGGLVTISAYNIEDNELWRRHIVTAISQVTVALYVFCKSWPPSADKRLLAAAILLFIPGVFKCFEKPLALKSASYNSLVSSLFAGDDISRTTTTNREVELEEYIQKARDSVNRNKYLGSDAWLHLSDLRRPDKLFTDVMYAYSDRFSSLNSFWSLDDKRAYRVLNDGLSNLFDLLYTKDTTTKVRYHLSYFCCAVRTRISTVVLPIVAIGLFHSSHKKDYRGSDVRVTYVLLYITFLLEIFSFFALLNFHLEWPETIPQQSLIGFFARNKRQTWLMSIMGCLQLKDFFDKYWCTCSSARAITNLVRGHVKDGWLDYILDAESYRAFSDSRGHWTLEGKGCGQLVSESIEKPFDESILQWHVATDFCFHSKGASPDQECARRCREISNYMMHLLFANPDMLMPGSRTNLFTAAYKEIEGFLHGEDLTLADEKELAQKIADKVASSSSSSSGEGFVHDAWVLSQELMRLGDEQRMWEVIEGVWVEMICFSAGRCRGFLHAKSLGSGGEYLSFIWLLMSHAGLETFAERQQRVQLRLPKEERVKIAMQRIQEAASNQATDPSTAKGTVPVKEQENAATPAASEADGPLKQEGNYAATTSASQGECVAPTSAPAVEIVVSP